LRIKTVLAEAQHYSASNFSLPCAKEGENAVSADASQRPAVDRKRYAGDKLRLV
jgi:hypothetical protein